MTTRCDGRTFTRLCAAVLALCILHHLLMSTLGHALVMGSPHDGGMTAPHAQPAAMLNGRDADAPAGRQLPSMPMPLLGDCPAQQGVFPLLIVLTLLLGLAVPTGERGGRERRSRPPRSVLVPLLPPQQRRALLQVFTI